jgi:hypothetical protein
MTWLKGTTTWGTLGNVLTQLICGEVADSNSNTCAAGDKWVREQTRTVTDAVLNSTTTLTSATAAFTAADVGSLVIATGVPLGTVINSVTNATTVVMSTAATATASGVTAQFCWDTIRTPSVKDVSTGACANRTGYFANVSASISNSGGFLSTVGNGACKLINPFTSDPSTSGFHRWYVVISVIGANSVSGNYSTATLSYQYYDADTGALVGNSNATPNGAGNATLSNVLQVNVSDPSGFLNVNMKWIRAFTSTYMYGIDWWPMLPREGSTAPSFTAAPPGVSGTDYDIVRIAAPVAASGVYTGYSSSRCGPFYGLGIRTATGLGGNALYTVTTSMALAKCRIFNSATNGVLSLDVSGSKPDTANTTTMRGIELRIATWIKAFQTPASVSSSSQVQYWLSVKNDGIVLLLNGDPGVSGKMGSSWICSFTPSDSSYDVLPVLFNTDVLDFTTDNSGATGICGVQYSYWGQRRRQDASETSASRDWQTKWLRCDHGAAVLWAGASALDISGMISALTSLYPFGAANGTASGNYPSRQYKPGPDGKWWLYGFQYAEMGFNSSNWQGAAVSVVDDLRFVRGSHTSRLLYLADTGWNNGDELTDTGTSQKYQLATPDYLGAGIRVRQTTNTYFGGLAIVEV